MILSSNFRPILSFQHVDPEEAVQIHQDVRAVRSIGMHWGTFESTKEVLSIVSNYVIGFSDTNKRQLF